MAVGMMSMYDCWACKSYSGCVCNVLNKKGEIVMIKVNGLKQEVQQETLSYDDVIQLAGLPEGRTYTVVYTKGENGSKGHLSPRESVKVVEGLSINADYTGNA